MNSHSEILDRPLPQDTETERKLLGALIVSADKRDCLHADIDVFHLGDKTWHGYVYSVLRKEHRKRTYSARSLFAAIDRKHARTLGVQNVGLALAYLFTDREGKWRCGLANEIHQYIRELRKVKTKRARIEAAMNRLREAWEDT